MVAGMVHSISSARAEAMPSRSLAAYAVKISRWWRAGITDTSNQPVRWATSPSDSRSAAAATFFLEMRQRRGAGDRQHHRRALKEPRDRHLCRGRAVRCHPLKFLRSREPARPERKPRKKGDPVPLAALHDVVGASVANAVAILDRDDVGYRARPLELGDAHIRDADHPNLSLSLEVDDGPERLLDADTRVNRVQLVEIDHLAPQHLRLRSQ